MGEYIAILAFLFLLAAGFILSEVRRERELLVTGNERDAYRGSLECIARGLVSDPVRHAQEALGIHEFTTDAKTDQPRHM